MTLKQEPAICFRRETRIAKEATGYDRKRARLRDRTKKNAKKPA